MVFFRACVLPPLFWLGLLNLVLLDVPIWTLQSLKLLRLIRNVTTQIDEDLKSIKAAR